MICLLVTTTSPAKLAEPSRDAVWDVDLGGPSNHLLDGHPDPLVGRSTFEGDNTRISPRALYQHSNGWPLKQSVTLNFPSEKSPSALQPQINFFDYLTYLLPWWM